MNYIGFKLSIVALRNQAQDLIEYLAVFMVLKILEWLPFRMAKALAGKLAGLAQAFTPRWRRVAHRNLDIAFPEIDLVTRQRIVDGVYQNLGRILVTLAHMPQLSSENIRDWIRHEGYEHFQQALQRKQGVLFMTAHLGNWELSATAHSLFGHPMRVVIRTFDNPRLDALINTYRTLHGNRIIRKQDYGRSLLRALNNNEAVGVLVDQNTAGDDAIFVNFFGIKAATTSSLAKIAMRTGAAVIPGFALWDAQTDRYVLKFYPRLKLAETGDFKRDLVTNTQLCQSTIEEVVRHHPDQWLWIHRRWKHRPEKEPGLYS